MVPPRSDRVSRAPPYSRTPALLLPVRGCHPLWRAFPDASGSQRPGHWPGPRSLVTTDGVSVDVLSSGYLDISVRRVRLLPLWIHDRIPPKGWVAPFGDLGITGRSPLPRAYRSVPRPSSPLGAKASTRCPSRARPRPAPKPRQGAAHKDPCVGSPYQGSRPGVTAYPCPGTTDQPRRPRPGTNPKGSAPEGPGGSSCHARFTVTTRFTMSKRLAAQAALSRRRRAPISFRSGQLQGAAAPPPRSHPRLLVGLGRFERPTSRLSGVRSNQLSYRPGFRGAEPEPSERNPPRRNPSLVSVLSSGRDAPAAAGGRSRHRRRSWPCGPETPSVPLLAARRARQPLERR